MNPEIMICGDWHGDTEWAVKMVKIADALGIRKIVQVGDFGLWDHDLSGIRYLDMLNDICRKTGVKVYWVDGNHENHDRLTWYDNNNPTSKQGHVYIRSHILHSPRGLRWTWEGKTLMSAGGAVSVDRGYRLAAEQGYLINRETQEFEPAYGDRTMWWPGEQFEDSDLRKIHMPADYLFTHDAPTCAPFRERLKNDLESQIHRQRMDDLGKIVRPQKWFHGHYHTWMPDYDFRHQGGVSSVWGLQMNGEYNSFVLLNIKTGNVRIQRELV